LFTKKSKIAIILFLILTSCLIVRPAFPANSANASIQLQGQIAQSNYNPQLTANGTSLVDGSGSMVTLRGIHVDMNDREINAITNAHTLYPNESYFTLNDVKKIKASGGNCIELHENGVPELMPTRDVINQEAFIDRMDTWVNWVTSNQMYCIIDMRGFSASADWAISLGLPTWLWNGYPTPTTEAAYNAIIEDFWNLSAHNQDLNRQAFVDLWSFIANRYKDNPYVLFSISNEPFAGLNITGDTSIRYFGQSYSTFMGQIIDGIRSAGANQIIIVNAPFLWDSQGRATVQSVIRSNVMWEAHAFVASWCPTLNSWEGAINSYIQTYAIGFGQPLYIGEYGSNPPNYPQDWETILAGQVSYLNNITNIAGSQWPFWSWLYGEVYSAQGTSNLTQDESTYIIQTVLG
jgi:hypothetical protein